MPTRLSEIEKSQFCAIIRLGCDRATACMRLGVTPAQLRIELAQDEAFAKNVRRSAAEIELEHMRNLRKAGEDPKNWRVSQWWLERRAPQRYAARTFGAVSAEQLDALFDQLAEIIAEHVPHVDLATAIVERLERQRASWEQAVGAAAGDDPCASEVDEAAGEVRESDDDPPRDDPFPHEP